MIYELSTDAVKRLVTRSWPYLVNDFLNMIKESNEIQNWYWRDHDGDNLDVILHFDTESQKNLFILKYL